MTATSRAPLSQWLVDHHDELVAFRRHLHAHPEPSGLEYETTAFVAERLEVAGLAPRVLASGTGLICDIGDGDGPTIALRADIDALEMHDEKDVHYRSQVDGVAHACGHDVHTTAVLGAGLYLAADAAALPGRVRLIFQPAEERVPGGALDVIDDAGIDGVDSIFGVHCDPKLDVGCVGLRAGAITSAADRAVITLRGPGGHTARPELTVNMVDLAARVVAYLPDQVERALDRPSEIKVVFGSIHSGDASNVIPTNARMGVSVRTPSMETWKRLPEAFAQAVDLLLAESDAHYEVDYTHGIPPVINDAEMTETVRRAARAELGESAVTEAVHSWGGDDFAWYLERIPGSYIRVGTHDPSGDHERHDLHVGHFDVDERAIPVAVRTLASVAETRLGDLS